MRNILTWLRAFRDLPADVAQTYSRIRELQRAVDVAFASIVELTRARKDPMPFVCVLVVGKGPKGPVTLGATGRVWRDECVLVELITQVPMTECSATVFADLERVNVGGIFVGSDYMHAALGECPIASFAQWHPGVKLRVQATLRKPEP